MPLDQLDTDLEDDEMVSVNDEMSFIDHLEALRWHIIRSAIAIFLVSVVIFLLKDFVFDVIIFGPTKNWFASYKGLCWFSHAIGLGDQLCMTLPEFEIINIDLSGQFIMHLQAAVVIGFVVAFPYVFWEFWSFIKPGLHQSEITYTKGILFFTSILFIIGVCFGYFILTPFSINFFATYKVSNSVANNFTLTNYISFLTMFVLTSGLVFELPMIVYFLSKLGLLTPQIMREYRRHAIVIILFVSAVITPADVATQLLVFVPIYVLYELSIFISARVAKNFEKEFNS